MLELIAQNAVFTGLKSGIYIALFQVFRPESTGLASSDAALVSEDTELAFPSPRLGKALCM